MNFPQRWGLCAAGFVWSGESQGKSKNQGKGLRRWDVCPRACHIGTSGSGAYPLTSASDISHWRKHNPWARMSPILKCVHCAARTTRWQVFKLRYTASASVFCRLQVLQIQRDSSMTRAALFRTGWWRRQWVLKDDHFWSTCCLYFVVKKLTQLQVTSWPIVDSLQLPMYLFTWFGFNSNVC